MSELSVVSKQLPYHSFCYTKEFGGQQDLDIYVLWLIEHPHEISQEQGKMQKREDFLSIEEETYLLPNAVLIKLSPFSLAPTHTIQ